MKYLASAIGIFVVCHTNCFSQKSYKQDTQQGIAIGINFEKEHYLKGEPVIFEISATNKSQTGVKIPFINNPFFSYEIKSKNGINTPCMTIEVLYAGKPCMTIGPGEEYSENITVSCGNQGSFIPYHVIPTGDYTLTVRYSGLCTTQSEFRFSPENGIAITFDFSVSEPQGADVQIYSEINALMNVGMDYGPGSILCADKFAELWNKDIPSDYRQAIYIYLSLIWRTSSHYLTDKRGVFERINEQASNEFSNKLVATHIVKDRELVEALKMMHDEHITSWDEIVSKKKDRAKAYFSIEKYKNTKIQKYSIQIDD